MIDFTPLRYCRDPLCTRIDIHEAHGDRVSMLRIEHVSSVLVDVTCDHVGSFAPRFFSDIVDRVLNDYGSVTTRTIHRAIAQLVTDRRVASLDHPAWSHTGRRANGHAGWYIRYDSPKLWRPGGLRELQEMIIDAS